MDGEAKNWLEGIGLGQYAEIFARNRVDLDVLHDLTEADLAELGLPLGDRKRLLRARASLIDPASLVGLAGAAPSLAGSPRASVAAERRQLTVMFCDMVGSTALAERIDPEDMRDIITAYRESCARVVERYDGFVAHYSGDGIMVYFGYPNAHEDDAERAVLTGLEIIQTLATESKSAFALLEEVPAVRIGIATGLVVVGDVIGESTREHDSAVGETPNLASRLQSLAPPNGLVIADTTHSLLRAKFEYEALGSHSLRGVSAQVRAWRVVRSGRVETRFAGTVDAKLTPLVNREEEIALLLVRWQQAKERDGQVVLLSGEPGIGKSRILQEFRERIANEPHALMFFQCSPYSTSTPFYAFVTHLKASFGFDGEDSFEQSLRRLERSLAAVPDRSELALPLLAALLSNSNRYGVLDLSPQRQKDETVAALVTYFFSLARERPAAMIFEDAHWIDPTSREVLDLLVDRVQDTSVLMAITCRPEFQPSWTAQSHITTLMLNRLSRQSRATLVEHVAGARRLPNEIVEEIVVKTDGVPLFVEELTKAVLESQLLGKRDGKHAFSGSLRQLAIPATLTDSLMARLDRLAEFKKIAQIGATIGREFSFELLRAVTEASCDELDIALGRLEEAGLILRRGPLPRGVYAFKHALMQDAAYSSLLHSERRKLHARIAEVLAEMNPERAEREPELFAYHFTEAGQSQPAVTFWLKAGKHAANTGANLEAIDHLRCGLEVLEGKAEIAGRDEMELALRIELGNALIRAKGYAVKDVEENYLRALALGEQIGNAQKIFAATRGLWVCYFIRAELAKAHELGSKLLSLTEPSLQDETPDHACLRTGHFIEAHRALGMTMLYSGRFLDSRDHLERGLSVYDPRLHSALIEAHGTDPGIVSLSYLGFVLWFLGYPDQAREFSEQALASAERLRHPFTLAFALAFRAYLAQHLRDVEGTQEFAARTIAISSEHGFLHWRHQATMLRGWALVELNQIDEGLNQIRTGLQGYEAMEAWLAGSWFKTLLAHAYGKAGRPDGAVRALDDAFAIAERTGERFFLAELYRVQGEIALMHRGPEAASEAEACFKRSLELSRKQEALAWELRTAVSLSRLWQNLGKREEAAQMLGPVFDKFKKGISTQDAREAAQMMSELQPH
jgi:class 3 adenylate cyclase/predicted ATPase